MAVEILSTPHVHSRRSSKLILYAGESLFAAFPVSKVFGEGFAEYFFLIKVAGETLAEYFFLIKVVGETLAEYFFKTLPIHFP